MIIYQPNQYPAPKHYIDLHYATAETLSISIRQHLIEDGKDQYRHLDQHSEPVLKYTDNCALLLDVWAEDNSDWIASTVFFLSGDHIALREARTFGRWRNKGLVNLMTTVVQNITGWTKEVTGHRWIDVW